MSAAAPANPYPNSHPGAVDIMGPSVPQLVAGLEGEVHYMELYLMSLKFINRVAIPGLEPDSRRIEAIRSNLQGIVDCANKAISRCDAKK